jgi:hypothetical protein
VALNAINYRVKWTDETIEELKRLYFSGWTDQAIADQLGRTRVAIINKRDNLGLSHGQQCSNDRLRVPNISFPRFENITKLEARAIQEWGLCPDKEYPNINLLNLTGVQKTKSID